MAFVSKWFPCITDIPAEAWRALEADVMPFLEYDWLSSLEKSGCLTPDSGWAPLYLTLWRGSELKAVAPLFLKMHSWGEFIFDQEWANAAMQMGIPYYPKLVGMSPFTPARGYRFLIAPDEDELPVLAALTAEIDRLCRKEGIAGCHFLHLDAAWKDKLAAVGWSPWLHHALIWENRGDQHFEDYLSHFTGKQRKNIKRERRLVAEQGIQFQVVRGTEAPELFERMHPLYADTCAKFANWSKYLTPTFFTTLGERVPHRVVFVVARDPKVSDQPMAMSLLVHKGDHLFGRYWGSLAETDHLHFETCYYRAIEWAVANGVRWFHAGSGSARHKHRRGFHAKENFSLHKFYHPVMTKVWDQNIDRINQLEQLQMDHINGKDVVIPEDLV